jgi:hypothetical protein
VARFLRHPGLQEGRQLQFVEAEHRQRQENEDAGEGAENPGILQRRRQQRAGEAGGDPGSGVGCRHPQHVGQRQQEAARMRDALPGAAGADDDARQDRNHRKDAGRQRQQQTEAEEAAEQQPEAGMAEELRNAAGLVACGARARGCRDERCRRRVRHLHRELLLLWRIADASVSTAL